MSKYFNDNQNKTKKNRSLIYLLLFIFAILAAPVIPMLYYFTDLFLPMEKSCTVAVESGNGEIYETNFIGTGAVNKKGEFLFRYNAGRLNNYIGLYLDTGSWTVSDTANPYFKGKIDHREGLSYHASETVYDSASKSHQVDTFYNQDGELVWSYDPNEKKDTIFQTVIVRETYGPTTSFDTEKFINVNQFLIQKYNINAETIFDKENNVIIFKVPELDFTQEDGHYEGILLG